MQQSLIYVSVDVDDAPRHQANRNPGSHYLGHCHWNEVKGLMVSAKQVGRRRPAFRQQTRCNRGILSLQMGENLLNDRRVFDAGDHFVCTAAGKVCLNVDIEDLRQPLRQDHNGAAHHSHFRAGEGVNTQMNDRFRTGFQTFNQ